MSNSGELSASSQEQGKGEPAMVLVVDFPTFVGIIMREPTPDLRFKEIPQKTANAALFAINAAAKAVKVMRKLPASVKR